MRRLVAVKFKCDTASEDRLMDLLWERVGEPTVWRDGPSTALIAQDDEQGVIVTAQCMKDMPALVRVCCVTEGDPKGVWPIFMVWGEALARTLQTDVESYWYEIIELRETGTVTVHDAAIAGHPIEKIVTPPKPEVIGVGGAKSKQRRDC